MALEVIGLTLPYCLLFIVNTIIYIYIYIVLEVIVYTLPYISKIYETLSSTCHARLLSINRLDKFSLTD